MTLLTLLSVKVTIIRQGGQDDPSFFSHPSLNPLAPSETKALLQKVLADEPTGYQPPAAHGPCDETHQLLEDKSLSDDYLIATSAMRHLWYWGYSQIG